LNTTKKYTVTVIDKVFETSDTCTIKFKQPSLKKITYLSGQFITLNLMIEGRLYRRPYSISSVFNIDNSLNITVKAIQNGKVSKYIYEELKIGQSLEIDEPLGNFILPQNISSPVILWAAGSGIAPIYAHLRFLLYKTNNKVLLNFSSSRIENTIFLDSLQNLKKDFNERFFFQLFLSKAPTNSNNDDTILGRLSEKEINDLVTINKYNNATLHYICGPNEYNVLLKQSLLALGCNEHDIFIEDFKVILNEEELKNVVDAEVNITNGVNVNNFKVLRGNSILSKALDLGLNLNYSCQTGTCELCKGQILLGSVKEIVHHQTRIKSTGEECLLCSSLPLTKEISISIN